MFFFIFLIHGKALLLVLCIFIQILSSAFFFFRYIQHRGRRAMSIVTTYQQKYISATKEPKRQWNLKSQQLCTLCPKPLLAVAPCKPLVNAARHSRPTHHSSPQKARSSCNQTIHFVQKPMNNDM